MLWMRSRSHAHGINSALADFMTVIGLFPFTGASCGDPSTYIYRMVLLCEWAKLDEFSVCDVNVAEDGSLQPAINLEIFAESARQSKMRNIVFKNIGLFSVSRRLRSITIPIFFAKNTFRLHLRPDTTDLILGCGQLACESISRLRIDVGYMGRAGKRQRRNAWCQNLAYTLQYLRGLRSVLLDCSGPYSKLKKLPLWIGDLGDILARPEFDWMRTLIKFAGFDEFHLILTKYYKADCLKDLNVQTAAAFRRHLQSQIP